MKSTIRRICQELEKQENIRILWAVENGSRAWRISSTNSDYDVRFVYKRPIEEYHHLHNPKEAIEAYFDKNGKPCEKPPVIDMVGWDIHKFTKLLSKSNNRAIEWLITDIVYYGEQNPTLRKFALENFNWYSLYYSYRAVCKRAYNDHLKEKSRKTYKRYLYSLMGIVQAKYIKNKKQIPLISFLETLEKSKEFIEPEIIEKLQEIIELKKQGQEKDIIKSIPVFDKYIEDFLAEPHEKPKETTPDKIDILDKELEKIVLGKKGVEIKTQQKPI